jgi:hypothetical protein
MWKTLSKMRTSARSGRIVSALWPNAGKGGEISPSGISGTPLRIHEPLGLLFCLGIASGIYALSQFHSLSTGDELVPVLVSTQSMSMFYWGADRFGMLLPLLAVFIRDPFWNLVAQNFLCASVSFFSFFAACRFFFGPRTWLLAGSMMALITLVWPPVEPMGSYMSIGQSFAPSAAALFAGLLVLGGGWSEGRSSAPGPCRMLAGLVLLCLSLWVNIGMFLTALPLAFGSYFLGPHSGQGRCRQARHTFLIVGFVVLALAVNLALKDYFAKQYSTHDYSLLPFSLWHEALASLAANFMMVFYSNVERNVVLICVAVASCVCIIAMGFVVRGGSSLLNELFWAAGMSCLAALSNYIFYGTNAWVRINHYEGRYLLIVNFLLMCILCGAAAAAPMLLPKKARNILAVTFVILIPLVSLKSYGIPSVDRLEGGLEERFGAFADKVLDCGCTHVAGTYWKV